MQNGVIVCLLCFYILSCSSGENPRLDVSATKLDVGLLVIKNETHKPRYYGVAGLESHAILQEKEIRTYPVPPGEYNVTWYAVFGFPMERTMVRIRSQERVFVVFEKTRFLECRLSVKK